MNILLLNQDWFAEEWRAAGHNVLTCGLKPDLDVTLHAPYLHIDNIINDLPSGFRPDRLVVYDNSSPLLFSGIDELKIPCFFYSVDTHHHWQLHRHLYQVFDGMAVAQSDYLPLFKDWGQDPTWLPLWASRYVEPSYSEKRHGAVFVGNIDPELNPERKTFFDELTRQCEVLCTRGAYWEIFPFSEIVVNQTVKGDLNFRVFEAMMCGGMLLTEKSDNGLFQLFKDGLHLVSYKKNDVKQAAEIINYYLAHPEEARAIAKAGREEIVRHHLPQHRAETLLRMVENLTDKRPSPDRHFSMAANFTGLATRLRMKNIDDIAQKPALILAMRAVEQGLQSEEPLREECALQIITAAFLFDITCNSSSGRSMLDRLCEAYPKLMALKFAKIRVLLNQGQIAEARKLSERISPLPPEETFSKVEELMSSLLI
ncbi:MAG: glycosyltransferase family 1 protein [Deltaproteobacteria bacterium]|nr:glycosyltransferase family 1 protein [Deltaproteobacteria bacterium]